MLYSFRIWHMPYTVLWIQTHWICRYPTFEFRPNLDPDPGLRCQSYTCCLQFILVSPMWIRIQKTDPYSEYGSVSTKFLNTDPIWIRIHNTCHTVCFYIWTKFFFKHYWYFCVQENTCGVIMKAVSDPLNFLSIKVTKKWKNLNIKCCIW